MIWLEHKEQEVTVRNRTLILMGIVLCLGLSFGRGQETPVLPEKVWRALANELSGDIAFDYLRHLTLFHATSGGSEGFRMEAEWVAEKAREFGLEDVQIIWMEDESAGWDVLSGEAWIIEPEEIKLGDVKETPLRVADNSRTADVTAELVDVGSGIRDSDYADKDVKGKIVLASSEPRAVQRLAVWKYGALGIISYTAKRDFLPHQLSWEAISAQSPDGKQEGTFAWMLTPLEGRSLSSRLAASRYNKEGKESKPFLARVKIETAFGEKRTGMVEGWIRGTEINNQDIVLTGHMQEEKTSANDNRSAVASLLEIGRALKKLIDEGKLMRPKRNIRFWWVDEYSSSYQYFIRHPEEIQNMLANLNQDLVGAKQSLNDRAIYMSRTPWSRPSFLNDVAESVLEAVRLANTDFPFPPVSSVFPSIMGRFSRPLLSVLGTREPFRAEAVPYFDGSDHSVFIDGRIGIPGVALCNWPDPYIHSSDDDLWQVDPTQLKRNAFIIGGSAYFMAAAGEEEVPRLIGLILGGAQKRLARDSAAALQLYQDDSGRTAAESYADARILLEEAAKRELAVMDSALVFTTKGSAGDKLIKAARQSVEQMAAALRASLDSFYEQAAGNIPAMNLSDEEKAAGSLVPEWIVSLADSLKMLGYTPFWRFGSLGGEGLHPHYVNEVFNLIDGKRSALEIYRTVRAASLSAGEWYYGPANLVHVKEALERVAKTGAIRLNQVR